MTLLSLLLLCSKTEMLAKSNKFECETCGSHQEAQRRIKIRAAPSCLILHLKRFKFIEHLRRLVGCAWHADTTAVLRTGQHLSIVLA